MTRSTRWWPRCVLVVLITSAGSWAEAPGAEADENPAGAAAPFDPTLTRCVRQTVQSGIPTLIVLVSSGDPESARLAGSIPEIREAAAACGAQVVILSSEDHPREIRWLGVNRFPTVLLYTKEGKGLKLAGQHQGAMDGRFVSGWIKLMLPKAVAEVRPDPGLLQADYRDQSSEQQPSGQYAPTPPPVPKTPPAQLPVMPQPQPTYPAPSYPQAQPPAQYYYPQPQPMVPVYASQPMYPPQPVYMQPAPMPIMSYAPAPAPSPSPSPSPSPPNLLSAPSPAPPSPSPAPPSPAPPSPAPPMMYAPAPAPPMMYAPAPAPAPMMYAPAPAPTNYAPAPAPAPTQAAPLASAPVLTNPRLFGRLLGTVGESLAELKNPRVRMSMAPVYAPSVMAAPPQLEPIYAAAPPPAKRRPAPPPSEYEDEPAPTSIRPTPQRASRKSGWFSQGRQ